MTTVQDQILDFSSNISSMCSDDMMEIDHYLEFKADEFEENKYTQLYKEKYRLEQFIKDKKEKLQVEKDKHRLEQFIKDKKEKLQVEKDKLPQKIYKTKIYSAKTKKWVGVNTKAGVTIKHSYSYLEEKMYHFDPVCFALNLIDTNQFHYFKQYISVYPYLMYPGNEFEDCNGQMLTLLQYTTKYKKIDYVKFMKKIM
jgi:hypothetical protein